MGAFASPAAAPGGPHGQSQACKLWPAAIGLGQRLFSWTRPSGIPVMKYFESFCHVLPLRARGDRPETKIHTFAASPDQIPPVTNHRRSTEASLLCQENTLYWVNFQGNLALHGIEAVKVRNTIQEIFLVEKSAERGVPLGKGGGLLELGPRGVSSFLWARACPLSRAAGYSGCTCSLLEMTFPSLISSLMVRIWVLSWGAGAQGTLEM